MSRGDPEGDAAGGIDFVVGAAPGEDLDEELPQPAERSGRGRYVVAALSTVLAVLALARVLGTGGAPAHTAASSASHPQVSPAATRAVDATGDADAAVPSPVPAAPIRPIEVNPRTGVQNCPVVFACTVNRFVPAAVVQAVRTEFPGATVQEVASVFGQRDGAVSAVLLQRSVVATVGRTSVTVDVHPRQPDDVPRGGTSEDGSYITAYYRDLVPTFTITVEVRRPTATGQPATQTLTDLALLADEEGLLAT